MAYPLDPAQYLNVRDDLRQQLFDFAARVQRKEITLGHLTWEYLDLPPTVSYAENATAPVVFFAGGAKLAIYSFAVIDALSQHNRVIAVSQPGCTTLREHFAGLSLILQREGVDGFHVAGSSWGGCIAQATALQYAHRIDKTILSSTGLPGGRAVSVMLKVYLASIRRARPEKVVADFRKRALALLTGDAATDALWQGLFADVYDRHMTHGEYVSLIQTQIDYVDHYAKAVAQAGWPKPVLVITTADEVAGNRGWRDALPQAYLAAQVHVLERGGHHPALGAHDEYRELIRDFLGQ